MVAGDLTPSACISSPDVVMSSEDEQNIPPPPTEVEMEIQQYDGPFVVIKVKDLLGITAGGGVHQFLYPPFVTLNTFTKDVANTFKANVEDIELIYQCGGGMLEISKMPGDWTLEGASMPGDREKVYAVSIQKSKAKKKSTSRNLIFELDEIASVSVDGKNKVDLNNQTSVIVNLSAPCSSLSLSGPREFVGLKNMTMTCYLNSVLQSLWFTPELRNALYRFDGEHILKTQQKSVVEGLKRLFLLLQLSARETVGTEDLTQSFGWRAEESWTQHDIEEMFRVLSDALSKELKGTEMEGLFSALFGVLFADYISCQVCGNSREREDFQLGIPLPIRNFGQRLNNPCLEEAIQAYVSTELLTDENRVNCDICKQPTDAVKGLKFKKLPYVLMFHLKRYAYDLEKQTRAKINDKIEFPIILNMNEFATGTAGGDTKPSDENVKVVSNAECTIPNLNPEWFVTPDHGQRRTEHSRKSVMIHDKTLKSSLSVDVNAETSTEQEKVADPPTVGYIVPAAARHFLDTFGPHVYQLYSVLAHRGNLTGGHYFAYIFDFESNVWYRCDDAKVMRVSEIDLKATYGEGDSPIARQGQSLCELGTAYMLLYRKIDEKTNSLPLMYPDVPEFTQAMWLKMIEEDRNARINEAISRTVVPLSVKYTECGEVEFRSVDVVLPRTMTLKEAAAECHKLAFQTDTLPEDKARIVKYDQDAKLIEYSWKDDSITLDVAFPVNKCDDMKPNAVLLEIMPTAMNWEHYKASDTVLFAHKVNYKRQQIGVAMEVHVTEADTVGMLKSKLRSRFRLHDEKNHLQLFVVFSKHTVMHLAEDERLIGHLRFGRSNNLFFDIVEPKQLHELKAFVDTYVEALLFEIQMPNIDSSTDWTSDEENQVPSPISYGLEDMNAIKTCMDLSMNLQSPTLSNGDSSNDGSEATMIFESDISMSSDSVDFDESHATEDLPKVETQANCNPKATEKKYMFQVLSERIEGDWKILSVKAERKMTLSYLSKVLVKHVKVIEKDFIMYTAKDEKESEITTYEDKISSLYPFGVVRIRHGRRMSDDEARISIYYATPQIEETPSTFVCLYVFNKSQTVKDVKSILAKLCEPVTGVKEPERYRIRRKVGENPGKILKNDTVLFDYCKRYGAEIYIQTVEAPEEWDANNFAFFTRLWNPESLTVGGLKEITVYHDYSKDTEVLVAEEVSSHYGIPTEFLRVSKMTHDYPYIITAYAGLETMSWFQLSGSLAKISLLSDDLCLAVVDSRLKRKDITPEEMEAFRRDHEIKMAEIENVVLEVRPNRREIGLRINTES